jgi:aldose 1-epimerase
MPRVVGHNLPNAMTPGTRNEDHSMKPFALAWLALVPAAILHADEKGKPVIESVDIGKTPDGKTVSEFTLKNANGMVVKIITYGGIITELHVPDKNGKFDDVVLGFDNLKGYLDGHPYFGCITGRYCNRIAKGKFSLDGKEYTLATNNGPNHLHGGKKGFDKMVWKVEGSGATADGKALYLKLSYRSPDGEEGYPGNLDTIVTYTVPLDSNSLQIDYEATTDKLTVLNLTNHSYFNLGGLKRGDAMARLKGSDILGHELEIMADKYTPTDDTLIPTGKIEPVAGTPFDFTKPKAMGKDIAQIKADPVGYDLNYVLRPSELSFRLAARVTEPKTGRVMEVRTTEPGIQFYTGNFLDGSNKGKGGAEFKKHSAFCLETQHYPDSPNQPEFPRVLLKPGQGFKSKTEYSFSAAK